MVVRPLGISRGVFCGHDRGHAHHHRTHAGGILEYKRREGRLLMLLGIICGQTHRETRAVSEEPSAHLTCFRQIWNSGSCAKSRSAPELKRIWGILVSSPKSITVSRA